jgi:hypothetical protein
MRKNEGKVQDMKREENMRKLCVLIRHSGVVTSVWSELAMLIASFCVRPLGGGATLYLCVSRLALHPFIKERTDSPVCIKGEEP